MITQKVFLSPVKISHISFLSGMLNFLYFYVFNDKNNKSKTLTEHKQHNMAGKTTFTMIKPNAVKNGHCGSILHMINAAGFCLKGLKMMKMTPELAKKFYAVHKDRPFFNDLVEYMCTGPIVAAVIKGENAVESFRSLIGSTDPKIASPDSIRGKYGESLQMNAIHGSDSDENAAKEIALIFSEDELF